MTLPRTLLDVLLTIKKLPVRLFSVALFAFLIGCSSHPAPLNTNTTNRNAASTNGSSPATRPHASAKSPEKLVGLVVRVVDGDTIDVLDEQHATSRIRLQAADAPEKRQAFNDVARQNLATLVAGKTVQVEWRKHDQYGRIVGKVFVDDRDVCLDQIKAGLAWYAKEYESELSEADRRLYAEAEQTARSQKLGLWRDASPIQPSEFRHPKLGTIASPPAGSSETEEPKHSPSPSAASVASATDGSIRGNKNSKIYHLPDCPDYDKIAPHNRVSFRTREEAEKAGYRVARNCR